MILVAAEAVAISFAFEFLEVSLKFRFVLPIIYAFVSAVLVVGFGKVGHGEGGEIFYYLSLPSGAISNIVDKSLRSGEAALLSCFVAGLFQYGLLGYLIDLWLRRRAPKVTDWLSVSEPNHSSIDRVFAWTRIGSRGLFLGGYRSRYICAWDCECFCPGVHSFSRNLHRSFRPTISVGILFYLHPADCFASKKKHGSSINNPASPAVGSLVG